MKVGIDAISFYIPQLYLSIESLAKNRNIKPEKLINGLGLQAMSLPDVNEDVVSFAANAVYTLLKNEKLNSSEISRIYVGTESGVDASKPIASYIISLLEQKMEQSFSHCDALDITFACIGAVDALQNTLDYIRLNPNKKAIVVATDFAKYELHSTGEYTQGAGALAMLVTSSPSIISFSENAGISTQGVFDFFKPRRYFDKKDLIIESNSKVLNNISEEQVSIYKEQPIFDGQYSNSCYINRTLEAYLHYKKLVNKRETLFTDWQYIVMHLPYCFQARRTFIEIYIHEKGYNIKSSDDKKLIAKSEEYLKIIEEKIAPSEKASSLIGNLYTGSIFMAMLSALCNSYKEKIDISQNKIGFIAYGSGSKSKVFEGIIENNWHNKIAQIPLFETLLNRKEIDFSTYEKLHKKQLKHSISTNSNKFELDKIEKENPLLIGARYYKFID